MARWYYMDASRQQQGPVDTEALAALLQAGSLHWDALAWREGLAQWVPLREVAAELPVPPPVPSAATAATPRPEVVPAGFWRRWAALFIDNMLLSVAFYALVFVLILAAWLGGGLDAGTLNSEEPTPALAFGYLGVLLLYYLLAGLYYILQESGPHQATLGKRALGIKVVDLHGQRLSRAQAAGRWFAASLSYLTAYIGFLMAAFTERKQALHDLLAGTQVVDRWAYTDFPERQQRGLGGCAIAGIIALLFLVVIGIAGLLAAIALPAYQNYLHRAGVSQVVVEATPWRDRALAYPALQGQCADTAAAGINDVAMPAHVAQVRAGAFQGGGCGLEVTLGGFRDARLDGHHLWWQTTTDGATDGAWTCTSDIDATLLPPACRP